MQRWIWRNTQHSLVSRSLQFFCRVTVHSKFSFEVSAATSILHHSLYRHAGTSLSFLRARASESFSFFPLFAWFIVVSLAMTDSSICKRWCWGLKSTLDAQGENGNWSLCPTSLVLRESRKTLPLLCCLHPLTHFCLHIANKAWCHPPGFPCLFHIWGQTYLATSLTADLQFYRNLRGLVTQNPKPQTLTLLFWLSLLWRKYVPTAAPNLELRINTTNNFCFMGCIMWRLWKLLIFHKRSCGVSIMLGGRMHSVSCCFWKYYSL